MATVQNFEPCSVASVANYKSWAQSISGALSTLGFAKTSDTGQVVWSSVTTLPPSLTVRDYEVWAPTDALQVAGSSFFVRVDYGINTGNGAADIGLTIGTSTSGAGAITGNVISSSANSGFPLQCTGSGSTTYECDYSGDGAGSGRFGALLWRNNGTGTSQNFTALFGWERTADSSGNPTNEGVTIFLNGSWSNYWQRTLHFTAGIANAQASPVILNNSAIATDAFNGGTPISPLFADYGIFAPLSVLAFGKASDFTEGLIYTATMYGATRTFICTKNGSPPTNTCFLMRYD